MVGVQGERWETDVDCAIGKFC
ncbi:hypothetical protein MESS4_750211 [Mesorhizobium sp. STM 4661]|nr:hypothetical protein MESS4_750211 [Mesorhizobium sp. STM 4661]